MRAGAENDVGIFEAMVTRQVDLILSSGYPSLLRPARESTRAAQVRTSASLRSRVAWALRQVADYLQPEPDLAHSVGRY